MENLYSDLQFWKNIGYYGGGAFVILGMIAGAVSYYKTSQLENLIRIETKKEEDKAKDEANKERAKYFDILEAAEKARKEYQEKIQKLIEESQKTKQKLEIPQPTTLPEDNFIYENDVQNHLLKFRPKVGEWKKPIIAYPLDEKDIVNGKFTSKTGMMFMVLEGTNQEHKLIFSVASGGPPATQDNFYALHYDKLPSYVVVGDDGISMWRINIK